jgi:hypothetical protein
VIARVWHGAARATVSDEFHRYVLRTGVAECRATEGNRGVMVLRRAEGAIVHVLFISLWDSYEAIRRFAGEEIEKAVYFPEDESFLVELEPTVVHYECDAASIVSTRGPSGGRGR